MCVAQTIIRSNFLSTVVRNSLGRFGEAWTAAQLVRKGYRIVDRNVRYRVGEIDIVAYDGEDLVFVEVKCRRTSRFGRPEESLTARRFGHLVGAISEYLASHELDGASYRVDVAALVVDTDGSVRDFQLLKNVIAPGS
ncbi:MAG: YraN family protein [Chloroflexota bacterium]